MAANIPPVLMGTAYVVIINETERGSLSKAVSLIKKKLFVEIL